MNPLLKIKILYERDDLLVVAKPAGILMHPIKNIQTQPTLFSWLLDNYPQVKNIGQVGRNGIIHRLDRDVSGVLMLALSQTVYDYFIEQFKQKRITKYYYALVYGHLPVKQGEIDFEIGRNPKGKIVSVKYDIKIKFKKSALTKYEVVTEFNFPSKYSLLKVEPVTGRTNQIRVHLKAFGFPIVGDKKYKFKNLSTDIDRIFLHAYCLGFYDLNNKYNIINSNLPKKLNNFLLTLKK